MYLIIVLLTLATLFFPKELFSQVTPMFSPNGIWKISLNSIENIDFLEGTEITSTKTRQYSLEATIRNCGYKNWDSTLQITTLPSEVLTFCEDLNLTQTGIGGECLHYQNCSPNNSVIRIGYANVGGTAQSTIGHIVIGKNKLIYVPNCDGSETVINSGQTQYDFQYFINPTHYYSENGDNIIGSRYSSQISPNGKNITIEDERWFYADLNNSINFNSHRKIIFKAEKIENGYCNNLLEHHVKGNNSEETIKLKNQLNDFCIVTDGDSSLFILKPDTTNSCQDFNLRIKLDGVSPVEEFGLFTKTAIENGIHSFKFTHPSCPPLNPDGSDVTFLTMELVDNCANMVLSTYQINLVPTLTIYIHGLASDSSAMLPMKQKITSDLSHYKNINTVVDYSLTNNSSFEVNSNLVPNAIENLLLQTKEEGCAASKVDIVGHSMGGLLARKYIQKDDYPGNIRKLITLNSPHYGSQLADILAEYPKLEFLADGVDGEGGAVADLQTNSSEIKEINDGIQPRDIYTHSIFSTYKDPFNPNDPKQYKWKITTFIEDLIPGLIYRMLSGSLENDGVVTVQSQKGGLPENALTGFEGIHHTKIEHEPEVIENVKKLLLECPSSNSFSQYGYQPPSNLKNKEQLSIRSYSNPTIHITSSKASNNFVVGDTLTFFVLGQNITSNIIYLDLPGDSVYAAYSYGPEGQYQFEVKPNILGIQTIYAIGIDSVNKDIVLDSLVFNVSCSPEVGYLINYMDNDGDGFGSMDLTISKISCSIEPGYSAISGDCNDNDPFGFVVGMPCDDGDECTTGETIQPDCSCGGGISTSNGNNTLNLYSNGFLRISSNPSINYKGDYTVEFWAKTEYNRSQDIIDNYHSSFGQWMEGFYIQSFSGIMRFCFTEDYAGVDVLKCFDISPPNDRRFHHFAWVKSAQSVSAYVDGNLEFINPGYQNSGYNLILPGNHSFSIGSGNFNTPSFVGAIDELRIWRSALPEAEINNYREHSLTQSCRSNNLAFYLDMDQPSGIENGEVAYACGLELTPAYCNTCLAGDLDEDGICDSEDNCRTYNPGQEDVDCDGVGDSCDQCPGGNDALDNEHNGLPDCSYPPNYSLMPSAWKCAVNKVAICKVDKNKNTRQTICVSKNAVGAQVNTGNDNYCGPCNESQCNTASVKTEGPWTFQESMQIFPNPVRNTVTIQIESDTPYTNLKITDLFGRQIWIEALGPQKLQTLKLDIRNLGLKPGIYMVSALNGNSIISKKLTVAE